METIRDLMVDDHRQCDTQFVAVEKALAAGDWEKAVAAFARFREVTLRHLAAEEVTLFPAFEQRTSMVMGPTRVMRAEHDQMRQLIDAAEEALTARDAEEYSGTAETLLIMTQQHNMKEENILYPMCDQHLADMMETFLPQLAKEIKP